MSSGQPVLSTTGPSEVTNTLSSSRTPVPCSLRIYDNTVHVKTAAVKDHLVMSQYTVLYNSF